MVHWQILQIKYLIFSACFDCLYLLNEIFDNLNKNVLSLCETNTMWCSNIHLYLHPIGYAVFTMTIYTIVVISFERLHAICSPLTHIPIFWPYLITIIFYSITLMIPLFFHYREEYDKTRDKETRGNPMYEELIYDTCFHSGLLLLGNLEFIISSAYHTYITISFYMIYRFCYSYGADYSK